ncbi:unnamed protein product [Camellia sinensis]
MTRSWTARPLTKQDQPDDKQNPPDDETASSPCFYPWNHTSIFNRHTDSPKAEIHWTKTIDQQHIPGLKSGDIKVQVEGDNVLVISGERKREEQKDGAKYLRMERRDGKLMRKFLLLENANTDQISTFCQDEI